MIVYGAEQSSFVRGPIACADAMRARAAAAN